VRRRRPILVTAAVAFVVCGVVGRDIADRLSSAGFDDPSSEASRADRVLRDQFRTGTPNLVIAVTAQEGDVDDPDNIAAGNALTERLRDVPHVDEVLSYWSLGSPPQLRSDDGATALVAARITGDADQSLDRFPSVEEAMRRQAPEGVELGFGGSAAVLHEIVGTIEEDLVRAELIALPITLILLLLVFGSGVAALLPVGIGGLAVVVTLFLLRLLTIGIDVSVFALNLTTAMGLGLAIDYSLFVVSRYREEVRAGSDRDLAVVRTVATAGRTVAFSALTVAGSLAALLVFPLAFLRSFAYAGVAVAAMAGVCAVVVLPALLAVLGERVDKLPIGKRTRVTDSQGFWRRVAATVMRRPWPFALGTVGLLVLLGIPFLHLKLGYPDDRVLPASASTRQVNDLIREQFGSDEAGALPVVMPDLEAAGATPEARSDAVGDYAARLSRLDGVGRVDSDVGIYLAGEQVPVPDGMAERFDDPAGRGTWLSVVPTIEPLSPEGEELVERIRGVPAPAESLVTGPSAQMADSNAAMFGQLPLALGIVVVVTFVLLFGSFGSVLVPVKALVINVLSLTATFGAMVWIFQDGHLSGLLDFTPVGTLTATMPILMFCVAFGLSMDYEVFLLSRIKEEHDSGLSNERSVARGLERTSRIITAAALLMAGIFMALATSRVSFIKLFGVGLTLAVLVDAFVIRGTLVPAFMRLAGNANWWAPSFLRRLYERFGFRESVDLDELDDVDDVRPDPSTVSS
jgi:putative drug exporter of the RND superfamily